MSDNLMNQITQEMKAGQWSQAEQNLHTGLQSHPNSAKGWYYLAQTETHLDHPGLAQSALQKALSIDPSHSFAQPAYLEKLQGYITKESQASHHGVANTAHQLTSSVSNPSVYQDPTLTKHDEPSHAFGISAGILFIIVIFIVFLSLKNRNKSGSQIASPLKSKIDYVPPLAPDISRGTNGTPVYAPPSPSYNPVVNNPISQPPPTNTGYSGGSVLGSGVGGFVAGMAVEELLSSHHHNNQDYTPSNSQHNEDYQNNPMNDNDSSVIPPNNDVDVNNDSSWDDNNQSSNNDSSDFGSSSDSDSSSDSSSSDSSDSSGSSDW